MRVLIIGVGGVGAMAAWRLAKAGHEVVALEQFRLDHDRGSSFGDSRIARRVYPDALYTALMADAYPLWDELQAEYHDLLPAEQRASAGELYRQAGGIFFGRAGGAEMRAAQDALDASGVTYELLDAAECRRRYPAVALREDEVAIYEPSMSYVRASRSVRAAAALARRYGAQLREETPVTGIGAGPNGAGIRVTTASGERLEADRLVIAAGPWMGPMLASLGVAIPLTVTRVAYVHLLPEVNPEAFTVGRFPVWIDIDVYAYGFPQLGSVPGVKIGFHNDRTPASPKTADREVREADREPARRYAPERFPWLGTEVVYEKVCLYTSTPDEDFVIDAVPGLSDAYFLSSCSGHGFKFTPLLGQIAADLVSGQPISYDLSRFRLARFDA